MVVAVGGMTEAEVVVLENQDSLVEWEEVVVLENQ
jgi:hypothetical protein